MFALIVFPAAMVTLTRRVAVPGLLVVVLLLVGGCGSGEEERAPFSFTRYEHNPILEVTGDWESGWIHPYSVLRVGGEYWMWYGGAPSEEANIPIEIGLATSDDGLAWSRYDGNPVLSPDANGWDTLKVEHLTVLEEDGRFEAWYAGEGAGIRRWRIGYAESGDGVTWTRRGKPVLDPGPWETWDSHFVVPAAVLREDGEFLMYYWGGDDPQDVRTWKVGLATSSDGLEWVKHPKNPIFQGRSGKWDMGILDMEIVKVDDVYYMLYQGSGPFLDEEGVYTDHTRLGLATSPDGVNWARAQDDPFFGNGAAGSWDADWTEGPVLVRSGDGWLMYYMGKPVGTYVQQIGVALGEVRSPE
jgi:predicted GH43/DUF377 family glycosyl hydrolase